MTEMKLEFDHPLWGRPPQRDVSVTGAEALTLGDTGLDHREYDGRRHRGDCEYGY